MNRRNGFVVVGAAAAALSLVFNGVLARPLVVAALVLLGLAGLEAQRQWRLQLRRFTQTRTAIAALAAFVLIGSAGAWALQPVYQRYSILNHLSEFSGEGRQLEADFARRLAGSNQLQGESTAKIQDWHQRLETWIADDLGPFYQSRLATPHESPVYPPGMPTRLRVFWDILESDLAVMEQFGREFSPWLFRGGRPDA